jgi:hypothetical protein
MQATRMFHVDDMGRAKCHAIEGGKRCIRIGKYLRQSGIPKCEKHRLGRGPLLPGEQYSPHGYFVEETRQGNKPFSNLLHCSAVRHTLFQR